MSVLIVAPKTDGSDGIGMYTANLIEELSSDYDISLITLSTPSPKLAEVFTMIYELVLSDEDNVHLQFEYGLYGPFGLFSFIFIPTIWAITRWRGQSFFLTSHEVITKQDILPPWKFCKYAYICAINTIVTLFPDKVIFLSALSMDKLVGESDSGKYISIPHGSPEAEIELSQEDAKKELGFDPDDVLLVEPGYIVPRKGSDIFSNFADQFPNYTFILAGGAKDGKEEFYNSIQSNKPENLIITGRLPDYQYNLFIKAADLVILPYVEKNQSGVANVTSQSGVFNQCASYGVPVIAHKSKYFKRIEEEYSAVITIDAEDLSKSSDKIETILNNENIRTELSDNIKQFGKKNSMEVAASKHKEIYGNNTISK